MSSIHSIKRQCLAYASALLLAAVSLFPVYGTANTVGLTNLLMRNRTTGDNKVWLFDPGPTPQGETIMTARVDDLRWKIAGTGDFDGDGFQDIVWNQPDYGINAIWLMGAGGNGFAYASTVVLPGSPSSPNWFAVGVADFSGDGQPDILFHNNATGASAVWVMSRTNYSYSQSIVSTPDNNWIVSAVADMNFDGKPDLILRNLVTGQIAFQYMNGFSYVSTSVLLKPEMDQDYIICYGAKFTLDSSLNLTWRNAALGMTTLWTINPTGNVFQGEFYLLPNDYNRDWRMPGMSMDDTIWRIERYRTNSSINPYLITAYPSIIYNDIYLTFSVFPYLGAGMTVQRRSAETWNASWTTLATGLQNPTYDDTSVTFGQKYEYRVLREGYQGYQEPMPLIAGINIPETQLENRGKVLILLDPTLVSESVVVASLDQYRQDLVGDGWTVVQQTAAYRQNDENWSGNPARVAAVKAQIKAEYDLNPSQLKSVVFVGHIPVPYSGIAAADDHSDHVGAWPCDYYYADMSGVPWADTATTLNSINPICENLPGDGKFDFDTIPAGIISISVSRIDFAKLPVWATPELTEPMLIQRYFSKNHLYRHKQYSWQTEEIEKAVFYNWWGFDQPSFAFGYATALQTAAIFGNSPGKLVVADTFIPQPRNCLWGILAGAGSWEAVNAGHAYMEHNSTKLTDTGNSPTTVFCAVTGSYFTDWNTRDNNLVKSIIATPTFGLAATGFYQDLRLDGMGAGEDLGTCILRTINGGARGKEKSLFGDGTLRLHVLAPPGSLTAATDAGNVVLNWYPSVEGSGYLVYRSVQGGPFVRLSPNPITGTSFTDISPVANSQYMVRVFKTVIRLNPIYNDGSSIYNNLSQGIFVNAP